MGETRGRLVQAADAYRQAQADLDLAREQLIDELLAAGGTGWTQRALEEVSPVSRMTINTWIQRRLREQETRGERET